MNYSNFWRKSLESTAKVISKILDDSDLLERCSQFSEMLVDTYKNKGTVFSCGNGGSHCDAMHFAEEFTGRFLKNRRPMGALALGTPADLTCVANDFGFDQVFVRQFEGLARNGDLLLGISTSGRSLNICRAFESAKSKNIRTVALLGRDGGHLKSLADLAIVVPAEAPHRIQEVHIKLIHTVIESVERELFPELY